MFWTRPRLTGLFFIVLLFLAGCSRAQAPVQATPPAPTPTSLTESAGVPVTASTATPAAASTPETPLPSANTLHSPNSCNLIDSSDLAHLFTTAETNREPPEFSPVSKPAFSDAASEGAQSAGKETTCVFYTFHQPGSQNGWMLQVTYRVDVPEPSAVQGWNQAWTDAKAKSGQPVSGLADDAFASGAKLAIKKGDIYLTFEAIDTRLDEKTSSGAQQLLTYEKQLAAAALARLR